MSDDERRALHDPRLHLDTLTRLSSERLQGGDPFGAFIFADRRCRMAHPRAHDVILRGEALRRLGFAVSATADLAWAATLDPTDSLVTRRLIDADDDTSDAAARWVLVDPRSPQSLIDHAARDLLRRGLRVIGSVVADGDRLTGWVSWHRQRIYALRIDTSSGQHDLRLPARATDGIDDTVPAPVPLAVRLPAPFTGLSVLSDDRPFAPAFIAIRINPGTPGSGAVVRDRRPAPALAPGTATRLVSVVVPVYDDVDATRACLLSLAAQRAGGLVIRTVIVNDAAPDPAMTALLAEMSARHGFDLIVNRRNLGFIGAVNRALEGLTTGDVVLLNADVVLPPDAIVKLAAVADKRPDVGIVNPLTNNGQFNSFPAVFGANAFGDRQSIAGIDAMAGAAAAGVTIETPGGIGYCMYVTRACLDAVGPMPEVYLRGYYEDVEFCLRARERGFLTVCAPNIYVGHKGSVSFKDEKRRLVARNERVNEARFPDHPANCRAFRRADPLRAIRATLEAKTAGLDAVQVVVAGSAIYAPVLRARAATLAEASVTSVTVSWALANGSVVAEVRPFGASEPRQAVYRFDRHEENAALRDAILALAPRRIEVAGAPGLFEPTLDALRRTGIDLGVLLCESNGKSTTLRHACPSPDDGDPCPACIHNFDRNWSPQGIGHALHRALQTGETAPSLFVPTDAMAQELATDLQSDGFSGSRFEQFVPPVAPTPASPASLAATTARLVLALPYPEPDDGAERFLAILAAAARRRGSPWSFVLLGQGLDDRRAMSSGNVFVTGPMPDDEVAEAAIHYGAAALLAPHRWSGYGFLARLASVLARPKAYFDWSIGAVPAHGGDLAIDPRVCDAKAADTVCLWLDGLVPGRPS